jgi:hypothetical protein
MKKVVLDRPDIVFYLKLSLLRMEPVLYQKSKDIVCSKSVKYLEDAFEKKSVPHVECPSKEIDENMKFMEEHGITGVPALIFPDGSIQSGYMESAPLIKKIDDTVAGSAAKKSAPAEGGKK